MSATPGEQTAIEEAYRCLTLIGHAGRTWAKRADAASNVLAAALTPEQPEGRIAELERLKDVARRQADRATAYMRRAEAAEAEVERLREALREAEREHRRDIYRERGMPEPDNAEQAEATVTELRRQLEELRAERDDWREEACESAATLDNMEGQER